MAFEARNERIKGTDIYLFGKDTESGIFTYSRPISSDEGKLASNGVNGLNVSENGVLYNMNTLRGIQANRKLMKETSGNVWFPTIKEGLLLHDARLLPSGELMDFGLALYDGENPDKFIAGKLMASAKQKGYDFPILASFKSLDLEQGGKRYGVTPIFVSQDGLITGEDAKDTLKKFSYVGNSGVHRLIRDRVGDWLAGWGDYLGDSGEGCRVGRVSAVGSAKNIAELAENEIRLKYDANNLANNLAIRKDIASLETKLADLQNQLTQNASKREAGFDSTIKLLA